MRSARLRPIVLLMAALAFPAVAAAGDLIGTTGPLRSAGYVPCDGAWAQGACDPPPVDANLTAAEQSQAHVGRALKLIALARMPQARENLDAAVKADPRNISALKLRARVDGNQDAEADVNAGLLLDPNDSDLLAMRAWLLNARGEAHEALRSAEKAIRNNPRSADALWIRASVLFSARELERAETDLDKALALEPDYIRARSLQAIVRMRLNRTQAVIEDASRILEQHPADNLALQLRSVAQAALGNFEGVVSDLTKVLGEPGQRINATSAWTEFSRLYIQRAVALVRLGRHRQAMQDIETVATLGGQQAILRMQVYLRSNGFPDVPIDGKRSGLFDDAMKACFVDQACGRGIAERV
jgi:tetratricopeptide (TPR) repeat protein